jgi:hypothetical protein
MFGFILTGLLATLASGLSALIISLADDDKSIWSRHPRWRVGALQQLKALSPDDAKDPIQFWTPILEGFVLNLSDQQLITGVLLVTLSFAKYFDVDRTSLGIAADLVFFSMITHIATIMAIQQMLRDHVKLASLRVSLALITLACWLTIQIEIYWIGLTPWLLENITRPLVLLTFISSFITLFGILWAFWGMCLSLMVTNLTLKARKAIGRGDISTSAVHRQHIMEWLESSYEDHSLPKSALEYVIFSLRKIFSLLFGGFCRIYMSTNSPFLRIFLRYLAEFLFPFRTGYTGFVAQFILFGLGILNLALDLDYTGLISTWSFGQCLPTFMVLLPFFSLFEVYARE